jgi:hypothetical protein
MNTLSFELIEDSRFPNKDNIQTLVQKTKVALEELGNEYFMTDAYHLDWGKHGTQERVTVHVKYNRQRARIIAAINTKVYPVPYQVNGKNI